MEPPFRAFSNAASIIFPFCVNFAFGTLLLCKFAPSTREASPCNKSAAENLHTQREKAIPFLFACPSRVVDALKICICSTRKSVLSKCVTASNVGTCKFL